MTGKSGGNAAGMAFAIITGFLLLAVGVGGAVMTGDWMPLLCGLGFLLAIGVGGLLISLFWLVALWPLLRLTAALAERVARRQKDGAGLAKHDVKDK